MLEVVPVNAFKDNYVWTLRNATHAAVVDPGEARPVLDYLAREKLQLCRDPRHAPPSRPRRRHRRAAAKTTACRSSARRNEPIPTLTHPVSEGDRSTIPELGASFSVLDIPGHTRAHIAYYGAGSLFCGDTLFACGCGRVFEGTAEQMYASLEKLAALPDETKVYCGHEYTLANIGFAKAVEPGNAALTTREARDRRLREAGKPTLPSRWARKKPLTLSCAVPSRRWSSRSTSTSARASPIRCASSLRSATGRTTSETAPDTDSCYRRCWR